MPRKDETQEVQEEPRRPYEEWARELGTPGWLLAATKAKHRWPEGKVATRAEYEAAVKAAMKEVIR